MRDSTLNILKGSFIYDYGRIAFSPSKIVINVPAGGMKEGSFSVHGNESRPLEGRVISMDSRMECLQEEFHGHGDTCGYIFHAEGLNRGDVIRGNFIILSNQGEYELEYVVSIGEEARPGVSDVHGLVGFCSLARNDWDGAVRLFYSDDFSDIISGAERELKLLHKVMSGKYMDSYNVEDFLVFTGQKNHPGLYVYPDAISINTADFSDAEDAGGYSGRSLPVELTISRSGWGPWNVKLYSEDSFISFEKNQFTGKDFDETADDRITIRVFIERLSLHGGINYGRIKIKTDYESIEIPVCISNAGLSNAELDTSNEKKRLISNLMRLYLNYRLKIIGSAEWIEKTEDILSRWNEIDESSIQPKLFRVQILITKGRPEEAEWLLNSLEETVAGNQIAPEIKCYYLYLRSLITQDEEELGSCEDRILTVFEYEPENWRIGWLAMHVSEEYSSEPIKRLDLLKQIYRQGNRSPAIYLEILLLYLNNPAFLEMLDGFSLSVLDFAARYGKLKGALVDRILILAEKEKIFSGVLFRILKSAYEADDREIILSGICSLLIKGGKYDNKYFPLYQKALKLGLNITRLYEAYALSIDTEEWRDRLLPHAVYMYFAYPSGLPESRTAWIYANVMRHRKEIPELYESYSDKIREFVMDKAAAGSMDESLGYMYEQILNEELITDDISVKIPDIAFSCCMDIDHEHRACSRIIMFQPSIAREYIYPCAGDRSFFPVFLDSGDKDYFRVKTDFSGKDAHRNDTAKDCSSEYSKEHKKGSAKEVLVIFEDTRGHFSLPSPETRIRVIVNSAKLRAFSNRFTACHVPYGVYYLEKNNISGINSEIGDPVDLAELIENILRHDEVDERIRSRLYWPLMEYYYREDQIKRLDSCLTDIVIPYLNGDTSNKLLGMLMDRHLQNRASILLRRQSLNEMEPSYLLKVGQTFLEASMADADGAAGAVGDLRIKEILGLFLCAFKSGAYNDSSISFLAREAVDTTESLLMIWALASEKGLDTGDMEERMLEQMLYTGVRTPEANIIYKSLKQKNECSEILAAYALFGIYEYMVHEENTPEMYFEDIAKWKKDDDLPVVIKLSFLKFYRDKWESSPTAVYRLLYSSIAELMNEHHIFLDFMAVYRNLVPESAPLFDSKVIQYLSAPNRKINLHYIIHRKRNVVADERVMAMQQVYDGCYAAGFILFADEEIEYYITEEGKQERSVSVKMHTTGETASPLKTGRFVLINQLIKSSSLGDMQAFDRELFDYTKTDFLSERLFKIK